MFELQAPPKNSIALSSRVGAKYMMKIKNTISLSLTIYLKLQ